MGAAILAFLGRHPVAKSGRIEWYFLAYAYY